MATEGPGTAGIESGRVVYIGEILALSPSASPVSVRTLGKLEVLDYKVMQAEIEHEGQRLRLSMQELAPAALAPGHLYQVLGELHWPVRARPSPRGASTKPRLSPQQEPGRAPVLQARLARDVEGLDLALFDEALQLRRQFLALES